MKGIDKIQTTGLVIPDNQGHADELWSSIQSPQDVIEQNQSLFKLFKKAPFFKMIESGLLERDAQKRELFFNCMQIFSDRFQLMVYMRQGSCRDKRFEPFFLSHLEEEIGHQKLLKKHDNYKELFDPILNAIGIWFVYRMLVLDNIEKLVVMHLVVENAGDFYHSMATEYLGKFLKSDYYQIHKEIDDEHAEIDIKLIEGYPPSVYQRLGLLSNQSWMMMNTMVNRVYELVAEGKVDD